MEIEMNTRVRNNQATLCFTPKIGWLGALLLLCGMTAHAQQVFDLSADFSLKNNPNSVWRYGYSATNSLAPDQFRLDQKSMMVGPIGFWHPTQGDQPGPGYYPYIAYNSTQQPQVGSKGWAISPGEIAMEASNSGQYSLVRFVAPKAGTYSVSARFAGIHFGLSTTDVHVLKNGTSLFDADIDGYGGDPDFHKVQGASPTAEYSDKIMLKANDTITFAIGYGKNKTNSGDTTGLFARIVLLAGTPDHKR
jgi:hypothetical protein